MNDLFDRIDRVDEVDIKRALGGLALGAAIGGTTFLGGKAMNMQSSPSHNVPSAVKTNKEIPNKPDSEGDVGNKVDLSKPLGTLKIDINKIWQIESSKGTDPKMGRSSAGARGHFQFIKSTWDECVKKMGKDWDWQTGSMDYKKSSQVADFYLNNEIPRLLKHYKMEDTVENRLASNNWGVGYLKRKGMKLAPWETIDYIKKYKSIKEAKVKDVPQILSYNQTYDELVVQSSLTGEIYKYSNVDSDMLNKIERLIKHKPGAVWQILKRFEDNGFRIQEDKFEDIFQPLNKEEIRNRFPSYTIELIPLDGQISGKKTIKMPSSINQNIWGDLSSLLNISPYRINYQVEYGSKNGIWIVELNRRYSIKGDNGILMHGNYAVEIDKGVRESSIDFPRATLDKQIWQGVEDGYELKRDIKQQIQLVLNRYPGENLISIAKAIRIVGSICTNLYTESVDIDVHIEPNIKELKEILKRRIDARRKNKRVL